MLTVYIFMYEWPLRSLDFYANCSEGYLQMFAYIFHCPFAVNMCYKCRGCMSYSITHFRAIDIVASGKRLTLTTVSRSKWEANLCPRCKLYINSYTEGSARDRRVGFPGEFPADVKTFTVIRQIMNITLTSYFPLCICPRHIICFLLFFILRQRVCLLSAFNA